MCVFGGLCYVCDICRCECLPQFSPPASSLPLSVCLRAEIYQQFPGMNHHMDSYHYLKIHSLLMELYETDLQTSRTRRAKSCAITEYSNKQVTDWLTGLLVQIDQYQQLLHRNELRFASRTAFRYQVILVSLNGFGPSDKSLPGPLYGRVRIASMRNGRTKYLSQPSYSRDETPTKTKMQQLPNSIF